MNKINVSIYILISLLFASNCFALQEFKVSDGQSVFVKISKNQLTRIKSSKGALVKIWGVEGVLEVQPDVKNGEVFVKPTKNNDKSFSFFIKDSGGATYTIVASVVDIPSETIVLIGSNSKLSRGEARAYKASSYKKKIKSLMKAMMLDDDLNGYASQLVKLNIPFWKEAKITLQKKYTGNDFLGEAYTIKNISNSTMVFKESEFIGFGDNVRAISVRNLSLSKGQTTLLYIVRSIGR